MGAEQPADRNFQRSCEPIQTVDRHVRFRPFDLADKGPMDAGAGRQRLLAEALRMSEAPQVDGDLRSPALVALTHGPSVADRRLWIDSVYIAY